MNTSHLQDLFKNENMKASRRVKTFSLATNLAIKIR